ncbi:MAG TPA: hypothetical protein VH583_09070 [Vicinamibacterales bacterium]
MCIDRHLLLPAFAALIALAAVQASAQPADAKLSSPASALSGYMELQFTDADNADPVIDFRRFVLLFAHRFSDRIRFVSELEVEHAIVEGGEDKGELELEQAYLDFLIDRRLNIRAGQLLVPMGLINERHEPPVFFGVQRPFVDTFIIPTTWFDAGAGVFGEFSGGWRYRAYVMAPLDAVNFSADEGLSDSAQQGSQATVRHWAGAARVEYLGVRRLALGASLWSGRTSTGSTLLSPRLTMVEFDGRARLGGLQLRAELASVHLDQAGELNRLRALREGIDPNLASGMIGWYAEAAHPLFTFRASQEVFGFARYEMFDTQREMPAGYLPLEQFNRSAVIAGISYYPDPDVVVKVDYTVQRNQSAVVAAPRSFNVGLGWWF